MKEIKLEESLVNVIHGKNGKSNKGTTIRLIQNLKINLVGCTLKISVIILQMENTLEVYSMFLGRPWLKQTKVHLDWGNNTLTIIANTK